MKYVLGKKPVNRYIPDEELESESEGLDVAEKAVNQAVTLSAAATTTVDSDEDDALSYFQKLADS